MINDKSASELVSKSMRTRLSESEANEVREHLDSNRETRNFAKVATVIDESISTLADSAEQGDVRVGAGLSGAAKERLKDSVGKAILHESSRSQRLGSATSPSSGEPILAKKTDRYQPGSSELSVPTSTVGDTKSYSAKFTLVRKLGEGGLGSVWLARDSKLRRNVAIKQMNASSLETPQNWQRFHREAEITGHLEHPNIVPLYQFGIDSTTNEPFYAMRFVGKRTLDDAIDEYHERRVSEEDDELGLHRLLRSFLDVCQAIAYAHSRGVIHRDLKPENIALDSFGQVIVLDWGLAKLIENGDLSTQVSDETSIGDEALAKTMVGEVIGTPLYMAPEQASGDLDNIDERTDIFGLGAILFAILTGMAPHENSRRAQVKDKIDFRQVLRSIVDDETPQPRQFVDSVPRELEKICVKAMAKKRYARFESAVELADRVERWMAGQSQKQSRYETMRMEGRELRADLQATVRDLETNVRFMLRLPPVQELVHANPDENIDTWRERLATIFKGLLSAKSDYQHLVYCRVDGDEFSEIVRVERHSTEHANVRSVPKSRLKTHQINDYLKQVVLQKPEEVLTSLVCDPMCDDITCERPRLVAGVPVYDDKTEELYGVILIDCDLQNVFEKQMSRRLMACEVVLACDSHHIVMHNKGRMMVEESVKQPVADALPKFNTAVETLQTHSEYLDECDGEVYGARLWLVPKTHGLMYLLSIND